MAGPDSAAVACQEATDKAIAICDDASEMQAAFDKVLPTNSSGSDTAELIAIPMSCNDAVKDCFNACEGESVLNSSNTPMSTYELLTTYSNPDDKTFKSSLDLCQKALFKNRKLFGEVCRKDSYKLAKVEDPDSNVKKAQEYCPGGGGGGEESDETAGLFRKSDVNGSDSSGELSPDPDFRGELAALPKSKTRIVDVGSGGGGGGETTGKGKDCSDKDKALNGGECPIRIIPPPDLVNDCELLGKIPNDKGECVDKPNPQVKRDPPNRDEDPPEDNPTDQANRRQPQPDTRGGDEPINKSDADNLSDLASSLGGGSGGGGGGFGGGQFPNITANVQDASVDFDSPQPVANAEVSGGPSAAGDIDQTTLRPQIPPSLTRGTPLPDLSDLKKREGGGQQAGGQNGGAPAVGLGGFGAGGGGVTGNNQAAPKLDPKRRGAPKYFVKERAELGGHNYLDGGNAGPAGGAGAVARPNKAQQAARPEQQARNTTGVAIFDKEEAIDRINSSLQAGMNAYVKTKGKGKIKATPAIHKARPMFSTKPVFHNVSSPFRSILKRGEYLDEYGREI